MTHFGIDVSHVIGKVDWQRVRASGRTFAFCKATQHLTFKDPHFHRNRDAMRGASFELIGFYHFAGSWVSDASPGELFGPEAEADFFLATVGDLAQPEVPILDIEHTYGHPADFLQRWVITWCTRVQRALGRPPILYAGTSFLKTSLGADPRLAAWPLWAARYGPNDGRVHKVVTPWAWSLHQYTSKASVPGVPKPCDDSRFEGSIDDLRRLASGGGAPPPGDPQPPPDDLRSKMRLFQFGEGWFKTDGVFRSHVTTPGVLEFYRRAGVELLSPENNGVIQQDVFDDLIDADALRK